MARNEQDREDLLREATALIERVELAAPGSDDPIVVGFRRGGDGSIYFGADPVFQFNSQGELRRGFHRGKLLKAVSGRLIALERVRTPDSVSLVSEPLNDAEQRIVLSDCQSRIASLFTQLEKGICQVTGQVPETADVVARVTRWLAKLNAAPLTIAARANVGG